MIVKWAGLQFSFSIYLNSYEPVVSQWGRQTQPVTANLNLLFKYIYFVAYTWTFLFPNHDQCTMLHFCVFFGQFLTISEQKWNIFTHWWKIQTNWCINNTTLNASDSIVFKFGFETILVEKTIDFVIVKSV